MKRNKLPLYPNLPIIPTKIIGKRRVILTNDPSMTAWGYSIIEINTGKVIEAGCIKTEPGGKKLRIRKGDDTVRRVSEINQILLSIFDMYEVLYICSELPHGSQNASAAVMIGIVTGIIQTIADCKRVPLEWFSEGDAKKNLLGKRAAGKEETKQAIKNIYLDVPWKGVGYKDEAIADAMAVYFTACKYSEVIRYLSKLT